MRVSERGISLSSMDDAAEGMAARRELTMGQIRALLCLAHDGCSVRDMARRFSVARSTIQDNLKCARNAGLTWPLPDDLTNDFLEQPLFVRTGTKAGFRRRPEPDWALLAREMRRPGVNLSVLWEEYRQVHPEGYGYSRYVAVRLMWRQPGKGLVFLA